MCVYGGGVGGGEEDGVQEKTPTGQSSETVVESGEQLTVAGSPGIRVCPCQPPNPPAQGTCSTRMESSGTPNPRDSSGAQSGSGMP